MAGKKKSVYSFMLAEGSTYIFRHKFGIWNDKSIKREKLQVLNNYK